MTRKVYTTFILSASITRGVTYAKLTHTVAEGRYTTAPYLCPVPLTVRGTQALVSFAPLAFKLFYAARQNAVLRRSPFPPP